MTPQLIMTRPAAASDRFVAALRKVVTIDFDVIASPLTKIVPCDVTLDHVPEHLIFTSANGVAQSARLNLPMGLTAWCVGDRTADAARDIGCNAISAGGNAQDLLALIQREQPEGPMMHLHGRDVYVNFAQALGPRCTSRCVYAQVPQTLTQPARNAVSGSNPVIVPLFSPKAAALFVDQATIIAPTHLVMISEGAAQAASSLNTSAIVTCAKTPDLKGMVDETKRVFVTL